MFSTRWRNVRPAPYRRQNFGPFVSERGVSGVFREKKKRGEKMRRAADVSPISLSREFAPVRLHALSTAEMQI